jgi:hypothetical protein
MLTREDNVDAHAPRRQGWTITAIDKHLGHDRKTIRAYLPGNRVAGQRASSHPDPLEPFLDYAAQRLRDDPHVWGTTLFDEVVALGYPLSYPSFTRGLRGRTRVHETGELMSAHREKCCSPLTALAWSTLLCDDCDGKSSLRDAIRMAAHGCWGFRALSQLHTPGITWAG